MDEQPNLLRDRVVCRAILPEHVAHPAMTMASAVIGEEALRPMKQIGTDAPSHWVLDQQRAPLPPKIRDFLFKAPSCKTPPEVVASRIRRDETEATRQPRRFDPDGDLRQRPRPW